ncbi:hypothetical protein [Paraburkholderia kururiensis]|uniref:hypothetical protein n=1 Tax=Paraburkholderia kururiensis TaxID=984307 RepID=UPI000F873746|nr:hypothetical protein [Paraburkholderia kururiensis]
MGIWAVQSEPGHVAVSGPSHAPAVGCPAMTAPVPGIVHQTHIVAGGMSGCVALCGSRERVQQVRDLVPTRASAVKGGQNIRNGILILFAAGLLD